MYDIIKSIIEHSWDSSNYSSSEQQVIYYICGSLIIILTTVFIDLVYRVFSNFWRTSRK